MSIAGDSCPKPQTTFSCHPLPPGDWVTIPGQADGMVQLSSTAPPPPPRVIEWPFLGRLMECYSCHPQPPGDWVTIPGQADGMLQLSSTAPGWLSDHSWAGWWNGTVVIHSPPPPPGDWVTIPGQADGMLQLSSTAPGWLSDHSWAGWWNATVVIHSPRVIEWPFLGRLMECYSCHPQPPGDWVTIPGQADGMVQLSSTAPGWLSDHSWTGWWNATVVIHSPRVIEWPFLGRLMEWYSCHPQPLGDWVTIPGQADGMVQLSSTAPGWLSDHSWAGWWNATVVIHSPWVIEWPFLDRLMECYSCHPLPPGDWVTIPGQADGMLQLSSTAPGWLSDHSWAGWWNATVVIHCPRVIEWPFLGRLMECYSCHPLPLGDWVTIPGQADGMLQLSSTAPGWLSDHSWAGWWNGTVVIHCPRVIEWPFLGRLMEWYSCHPLPPGDWVTIPGQADGMLQLSSTAPGWLSDHSWAGWWNATVVIHSPRVIEWPFLGRLMEWYSCHPQPPGDWVTIPGQADGMVQLSSTAPGWLSDHSWAGWWNATVVIHCPRVIEWPFLGRLMECYSCHPLPPGDWVTIPGQADGMLQLSSTAPGWLSDHSWAGWWNGTVVIHSPWVIEWPFLGRLMEWYSCHPLPPGDWVTIPGQADGMLQLSSTAPGWLSDHSWTGWWNATVVIHCPRVIEWPFLGRLMECYSCHPLPPGDWVTIPGQADGMLQLSSTAPGWLSDHSWAGWWNGTVVIHSPWVIEWPFLGRLMEWYSCHPLPPGDWVTIPGQADGMLQLSSTAPGWLSDHSWTGWWNATVVIHCPRVIEWPFLGRLMECYSCHPLPPGDWVTIPGQADGMLQLSSTAPGWLSDHSWTGWWNATVVIHCPRVIEWPFLGRLMECYSCHPLPPGDWVTIPGQADGMLQLSSTAPGWLSDHSWAGWWNGTVVIHCPRVIEWPFLGRLMECYSCHPQPPGDWVTIPGQADGMLQLSSTAPGWLSDHSWAGWWNGTVVIHCPRVIEWPFLGRLMEWYNWCLNLSWQFIYVLHYCSCR